MSTDRPSLPPLVEPVATLTPAERERTARHHVLAPLGELGQRRLAAAHVAIVGAGGLGSPAVLALAAAGVGALTVIDDDVVELSNLQRQVMHRTRDVGEAKATSAARAATDLAPEVRVHEVRERLTPGNAAELLSGAHVVLDGSDTFDTREAVAAGCEELGVPLVWGTVQEFAAQVTVFWSAPPTGAPTVRLSDLYPAGSAGTVPTCAEVGVLGALCLQVGGLMATQAIQLIAGIGEPLLGRIVVIDGLRATQREVPLRGRSPEAQTAAPTAGSSRAGSAPTPAQRRISPEELAAALAGAPAPLVIDVRELDEVRDGTIPGALHLPLGELRADPDGWAQRLAPAASGRDVAVVCRGGVRSAEAATLLSAHGTDAATVAGGMLAWTGALGSPAAGLVGVPERTA
ncbi:ThiF family adenylyltransferase [Microbacterium album]|uniref:Adenylyltransferase/sulfurtransferase MoeZ n=1 Tax=Microbacterium album TaxID=2053191 RepID=A0A917ML01_9MICO|nr:ThiF family adenylyltransferase [Microbacterium album]GGH39485.1 adenylyltransferase/sulfurtransferase MoeZ [Microbacterium album]